MNELIFQVEHAPVGGLTARALGESIFTQAPDMTALRANVRDAVNAHFDEGTEPEIIRLQCSTT